MPGPSVDLLALLRPEHVGVSVAGRRFVLTASCASEWIGAIAMDTENLHGIMPGLIHDDDLDAMLALMEAFPDIETRWFWAARTALGRAAGRDWWWAHNLSIKSIQVWPYINGMLIRQGVNAREQSLPDWLDACYTLLWGNGDTEARMKLDLELNAKPRGLPVHLSSAAVKQMAADFAAD